MADGSGLRRRNVVSDTNEQEEEEDRDRQALVDALGGMNDIDKNQKKGNGGEGGLLPGLGSGVTMSDEDDADDAANGDSDRDAATGAGSRRRRYEREQVASLITKRAFGGGRGGREEDYSVMSMMKRAFMRAAIVLILYKLLRTYKRIMNT